MKKLVLKPMATQAGSRPQPPPASTTVVIGCDLARTKWVYSCRWAGQEQRRLSTPGELRHLQALVQEYQALGCGVEVAYEACGFGYEIAWWLEQQKVAVVPWIRLRRLGARWCECRRLLQKTKGGNSDARWLSQMGA